MIDHDTRAVGAVVVAAGSGERLGADRSKALLEVGGRPLVVHAVERLAQAGLAPPVVVVPPGEEGRFARVLDDHEVAVLVPGGATRSDSVRAGVAGLAADLPLVALHDAARPLVPVEVVRRVVAAMGDGVLAAAPALPVADTLKRVDGDRVLGTVDRDGLVGVQTPQVFPREVLDAVLGTDASATDELALVERHLAAGRVDGRIVIVPGSPFAAKVTYPEDLALLDLVARASAEVAG